METTSGIRQDHKIGISQKHLEQLSPTERQQFVADAVAETQKFVDWSTKTIDDNKREIKGSWLAKTWEHSSSKKLFLATLGSVGLANLGISVAGARKGMDSRDIKMLWYGTLGAPVLEELIFRSKAIPTIVTAVGKIVGIDVRPDVARRTADVLFGFGHTGGIYRSLGLAKPIKETIDAANLTGESQKKGLAQSMTVHVVNNSLGLLNLYLFHGSLSDMAFRFETGVKLKNGIFPETKLTQTVSALMGLTSVAIAIGIGINGVKEMINDKKTNDLLMGMRKNPSLVDQEQVIKITQDLLKSPSTDGYKFQAGVELGYVNAALNMPDILQDVMTPDDYARTQVHKMVTDVWKDPRTLPYRLEKANSYITEQIAKRNIHPS